MTSKCTQCNALATVRFTWGALPQQRADLCDKHAQQWWDTYKHTPAGQRLSISPTGEESSKGTDVARPKRRPYNASGSLSEYGVFPECDAQQPAAGAVDKVRFRKAPCYLCGYNGPGYYQPDTHPCAAKYHAT